MAYVTDPTGIRTIIKKHSVFTLVFIFFFVILGCSLGDDTEHFNNGNAFLEKNEFDSANGVYTKALEINSQNAEAYFKRGTAYLEKKDFDSAIKDLTKAIEINPQYSQPYNNRGNAYKNKKDFDSAFKDYTKAIEINPQDENAFYNRGNVSQTRKNLIQRSKIIQKQ
jgi:tetratricopeptide (TPR) repeat protein